jgi:hypothetical protein
MTELLNQNNCHQALKIYRFGIQDPGSEIWDVRFGIWGPEKPIPGPESRGQKGTGSRICNTDPVVPSYETRCKGQVYWNMFYVA